MKSTVFNTLGALATISTPGFRFNCTVVNFGEGIKMILANTTKFGIDFYDSIDFEKAERHYTKDQISKSIALTAQNFSLIRTITDFNEGDPGQRVGAGYQPIPGMPINARNSSWQEAVRSTELDIILTIENPKKWLNTVGLAVSYLYQFVLPLCKEFTWPAPAQYQPEYYGSKVINPEVQFFNVKNHIISIVVGLEVGTHLQATMPENQFESKADIVTNLNKYVTNLLGALEVFGLKNTIKVTSSFAPSNANKSAEELAKEGIYEFIVQKNGIYSFNTNRYDVNGVIIDFGGVINAINTMHASDFTNSVGFLLSVYSYWQYQPDVNFPCKTAKDWAKSTSERYKALVAPFEGKNCGIAEIGWPTGGSNQSDGSPNVPSKEVCENLLKGLLVWSQDATSYAVKAPAYVCLWKLADMEADSVVGKENPERYYGFYSGGLKDNEDNKIKFSELKDAFK